MRQRVVMSYIEVRKFNASEWELYRFLRLESLRDSPDSFGSTLERESCFSDQEWAKKLITSNESTQILPLVVFFKNRPVGLAWGVLHETGSSEGHIYQMWVSPETRGLGLAKALLSRIVLWANSVQLRSLVLAVTTTNPDAIAMYRSFGFKSLGGTEALREGSKLTVQPMKLDLLASNA